MSCILTCYQILIANTLFKKENRLDVKMRYCRRLKKIKNTKISIKNFDVRNDISKAR